MIHSKFLGACSASILLLSACGYGTDLAGKWVQTVPGLPDLEQGFILEKNGKASSVNMATLQYETWKKESDLLILSGKSIGNHQTISFQDTLVIERLTQDSLMVRKGELILSYTRKK